MQACTKKHCSLPTGAGCDEEAVRVIAKAKKWSPGTISSIRYNIKIGGASK